MTQVITPSKLVLLLVGNIFGLVFLQQLFLILYVCWISASGISDIPFHPEPDINFDDPSSFKIPMVIHQIWKDNDLSSYPKYPSYYNWTARNYSVKLWSEEKVRKLVKEEYEWLWQRYMTLPYDIQRADAARLIILHKEGGIYMDLDCYPESEGSLPLNRWMNADLVLPMTTDRTSLSNFFIMSAPQSDFLDFALHRLHTHQQYIAIHYLRVLWSTGPLFLTTMIREYMKTHPNFHLAVNNMGYYVWHTTGRSWHRWDGYLLSFIGDRMWILFTPIILTIAWLLRSYYKRSRIKTEYKHV
jgi:mannosyltransferase OCH1-like enzyme